MSHPKPPFPPREEPEPPQAGAMRTRPGKLPGSEIYEIDVDGPASPAAPMTTRPTMPAPSSAFEVPQPSERVVTKPSGDVVVETARPPVRARRALDRQPTNSGLGKGGPSPSFGGDTDFDSSVETGIPPPPRTALSDGRSRVATLSEPPPRDALDSPRGRSDSLELSLAIGDDAGDALDLVGSYDGGTVPPVRSSQRDTALTEVRERYALGDFSGALAVAEAILEHAPTNADAQRYAESCRDVLKQMYAARLGPMGQVPIVAIPAEQLRWLTLDHRSGFLLSHIDGVSTLEEILDISGMNQLEAMRIICDLLQQKVITLH